MSRFCRAIAVVIASSALGCSSAGTTPADEVPTDRCAAPELALVDGRCIRPGVLPDGCGEGFDHDGEYGCTPRLPSEPCPPGQIAVPGDDACRPLMSCGGGRWGDIPRDASTQHVDGSYAGSDSDGSEQKPWTTIGEGISAATAGAVVAVAAGTYAEDPQIALRPRRLWGVCPEQVDIVGSGTRVATLAVTQGAHGSEVHGVSIRGGSSGVVVSGATDVLFEQVWVHDNAELGIFAQDDFGATSMLIRGSLIENNREIGVFASGSELTVEGSAIRDTALDGTGFSGRGISLQDSPTSGVAAVATVRTSLIERSSELGVFVGGAAATLDAVVVRDTRPDGQGLNGRGVLVRDNPTSAARGYLVLTGSLLERNAEVAVVAVGSDLTVDRSVIRDTASNTQGQFGRGINVQGSSGGARALALVTASLLERNHELGMALRDTDATVQAVVVRDTSSDATGARGRGIDIDAHETSGVRTAVTLSESLVARNQEAGISVVGADGIISDSIVSDTRANAAALYGDGILVASEPHPGAAVVSNTLVNASQRAGAALFGASLSLTGSRLHCDGLGLNAESFGGLDFSVEDGGGNLCGCPAEDACQVSSSGLEPPAPVPPVQ